MLQTINIPKIAKEYISITKCTGLVKQYKYKNKNTKFHIYEEDNNNYNNLQSIYNNLTQIYQFMLDKYKTNNNINSVYIILLDQQKYLDFYDNERGDVNSAYYVRNTKELCVYKKTEYQYRFIHEMCHHLELEHICNINIPDNLPSYLNSIFHHPEMLIYEICVEYNAILNYIEIFKKKPPKCYKLDYYMNILSSIKNIDILAKFIRYYIFPVKMLEYNDDKYINMEQIMVDISKFLDKPAKYNSGILYV